MKCLWNRLQFLVWFAWHDVVDPRHCLTALAVAANVTLLTGVALAAFALGDGYDRVRLLKLKGKPFARCLWIGDPHGGPDLDENKVAALNTRLAAVPGPPVVVPFHECDKQWFPLLEKSTGNLTPEIEGRLCDPEKDFWLHDLRLQEGSPGVEGTNGRWVILSPLLSKMLRANTTPLPKHVQIKDKVGQPFDVALAGISHDPLPQDWQFLLSTGADNDLRRGTADEERHEVLVGPIPHAWEGPDLLPKVLEALDEFTDAYKLERFHRPRQGQQPEARKDKEGKSAWALTLLAPADAHPLSHWNAKLKALAETLKKKGLAPDVPLGIRDLVVKDIAPPLPPPSRAGVFVEDVPHLEAVESIAKSLGVPNRDPDVVRQSRDLASTVSQARNVVWVLLGAYGGVALLNIFVTQSLNARLKTAHVGMLKAMGIGRLMLFGVYLVETLFLWAVGLGLGLLLGWALGHWGAYLVAEGAEQRSVAFDPSGQLVAILAAMSAGFCFVSVLLPTCASLLQSPAKMLTAD